MITRTLAAAGAAALIALGAAGCNGSHAGAKASAAASLKAGASKLATNPAIMHDETVAKQRVHTCIYTTVGLVYIASHPVKGPKAVINCVEQYAPNKAAFEASAKALLAKNGFGAGALTADEVGLANLLVQK